MASTATMSLSTTASSSTAANATPAQESKQARIQLSTRDTTITLPTRTGPILVSTDLGRYALSRLVNTLLADASSDSPVSQPVPLAFLINGHFLHAPSIADLCRVHALSTETLLHVEYVRALIPPTEHSALEHDDWVASVDVSSSHSTGGSERQPRILSASFDGRLRVWDASCHVLATTHAPDAPGVVSLTAARWMTDSCVVSAGYDMCVRVWDYSEQQSGSDGLVGKATLTPSLELYGHTAQINHLATHAPSNRILSTAADHTARLWSSSPDASDQGAKTTPYTLPGFSEPAKDRKRRKLSGSAVPAYTSLTMLSGHVASVTACAFHPTDATAAYTTSLDTALKTWDLTTAACVSSIHPTGLPGYAALCLTPVPVLGSSIVAVGTTGRSVVLVDTRVSHSTQHRPAFGVLRGHRAAVSCLAVEPTSASTSSTSSTSAHETTPRISAAGYGLASGSHDGTVRIWDLRSLDSALALGGSGDMSSDIEGGAGLRTASAICSIPRQGRPKSERVEGGRSVKVFGVAWDREIGVVSCGEDGRVLVSL